MELVLSSAFLFASVLLVFFYIKELLNGFIEDFKQAYVLKNMDDYLFMLILVDKRLRV